MFFYLQSNVLTSMLCFFNFVQMKYIVVVCSGATVVGYGRCKRLVRHLAETLSRPKSKSYGHDYRGYSIWWET